MAVSGSRISKWMSDALTVKAIFRSSRSFDCTSVSVSVWSGLTAFATSRVTAGWISTGQPLSASSEAVDSTSVGVVGDDPAGFDPVRALGES